MRGRLVEKDVGEDYSPPRGEIPYLSDFLSWCIFQEKRTREREREGGGGMPRCFVRRIFILLAKRRRTVNNFLCSSPHLPGRVKAFSSAHFFFVFSLPVCLYACAPASPNNHTFFSTLLTQNPFDPSRVIILVIIRNESSREYLRFRWIHNDKVSVPPRLNFFVNSKIMWHFFFVFRINIRKAYNTRYWNVSG